VSLSVSLLLILGGLVAFNWITAKKLDRLDRLKQADEQRLKEQERLLSGVLDTVPVGIWITDSSGKITRGNPAGIDIWRGERYVGIEEYGEYKGWWADTGELIGPHDWALARALEKGETSVDETVIIQCFDGSQKVIMNSAMPLRDEQGNITGSIVTNYDISRRYRMEKNLALVARAGEEMISMRDFDQAFQQVATLMTTGLCDYSMIYKLEENGTLNMVARAGRDAPFAKRFDALVDCYPPNPRTNIGIVGVLENRRSLLIQEMTEDTIQSIAQDAHHAAELRQILHSYMLVPMVAEDKSVGILGLISCDPARRYDDIDLLAAEEMGRLAAFAVENVRYAEKLRQAVQAREDVVAIVSHDLRSPLAVILQSCELINKQLMGQEVPASVMKLTSLAKSAGRRMHELISDLLDLSHLESGQFVLHRERLDCLSFLRETVDLMLPLATQKGVSLALEMPDELPAAYADRTRMTQILNNLISNAIKHTPTGGSIDVQVRLRDDGWLEFVVSDTGCGIKSEYLPQLFERYWKPHESKGGFGLGLFVVKGIIEAHGGSIQVASEETKGTSFAFTIPSVLLSQLKSSVYHISPSQPSANAGQLLSTEQH
jgi:signal transduction histidine kinase